MDELIKKFFQTELTEAESVALARTLASSEDVAQRFAEKAEAEYFLLGQPEPSVPGSLGHALKPWLIRVLPLALLIGGAVTWIQVTREKAATDPSSDLRGQSFATTSGRGSPVDSPAPVTAPKPKAVPKAVKREAPRPTVFQAAPPMPGVAATEEFTNLEVIVRQEAPGPVLVRILAQDRTEVRRLYEGPLGAGQWSFKWDGILSDGKAAAPGTYSIEVERGSLRSAKEVIIR